MMNNSQGASSFFSGLSTLLGRPHPLLHNLSDTTLLVAIVTTLVASTFQDFGMDAAVWEALYVLCGLASVTWLWITGWQAWKLRSQGGIDEIVKTLKISVVVE